MKGTTEVLEPAARPATAFRSPVSTWRLGRGWSYAAIVTAAALLWILRWAGPIDLRYDAAVYYVLGTSIAEGKGYRLLNEPGQPEALQYPPLLPLAIAGVQKLAGTSDPDVVAVWLRRGYAVMFLGFAAAVLALARRFLPPLAALVAAAICVAQPNVYLVSDVLFTELPFTMAVVGMALVLTNERGGERRWLREGAAFLLGAAAFLLRTAGIAVLAAWVGEALLRKRWKLALVRALLAVIPVAGWQAHVARVQASADYREPAYAYQRAGYQFYNVSYAENMALIDPFRPELGRATAKDWVARIGDNLAAMPTALGEAVSGNMGFWRALMHGLPEEQIQEARWLNDVARFPLLVLFGFVLVGAVVLVKRREWFVVLLTAGSIALVCTTPWPGQFGRYVTPMAPFLTIALVAGLMGVAAHLWAQPRLASRRLGWAVVGIGAIVLLLQANGAWLLFRQRHWEPATRVEGAGLMAPRLFFYGRVWKDWQTAVDWIARRANQDDVIATTSPHLSYLQTGLRAVMPPMEADARKARELLESAGVDWVIVDDLAFLDISRRYARPAVENSGGQWEAVARMGSATVYRRVQAAEERSGT